MQDNLSFCVHSTTKGYTSIAEPNKFILGGPGENQPEHYIYTVEPRLSGFLDYPDFFCGPNFVRNIY